MQQRPKFERKGILTFLIITFAVTYAIDGALVLSGFRFAAVPGMIGQLAVMVTMWVPTLATFLTIKFVTREKPALSNLRFGSFKPYLAAALILPLCFALIYGLTWATGLAQPDWALEQFRAMFVSVGAEPPAIPEPGLVLLGVFAASIVIAPFLNGLIALGEEIGWRGYLLPRLMPLGKTRAYLILGIIWGLWHMPLVLIGFTYPDQPILGTIAFIAMTTTFGIYVNELALENNSCIVAAWVHGIFNTQKLGVWSLLFRRVNPLLGGYSGVLGIIVWFALGLWQVSRGRLGRNTGHEYQVRASPAEERRAGS